MSGIPELAYLLPGLAFGLSAGISPGPLLTLVMTQTLKHGVREGVKVSLAPLLTDLPIIIVALFILDRLTSLDPVLGAISLFGAGYLLYLGYESLTFKGDMPSAQAEAPHSIRKGIVANFLNPSPYMFWFSIGGPLMLKAFNLGLIAAVLFIVPFYCLLVGAKCMVAIVAGRSRHFLRSRYYIYTVRGLGLVMCLFGLLFVKDALVYFNLI
ncbi:MAG: LysE family translocator [Deltaproteobacteria bacterium]